MFKHVSWQDADQTDAQGNFVWNCAWECTPDLDDKTEDEPLQSYLEGAEL